MNKYLTIYDKNEFTPISPKGKGSRPGCLGLIKGNKFLLKVEDFAYDLQCTNSLEEAVALESLVSQIIRAVFGKNYAADIGLINIGGSENTPKTITYTVNDKFGNTKSHRLNINSKYAILSAWEDNCFSLTQMSDKHLSAIQTIAKLLNIDDYKLENIVKREDDSLFIVDCAADLSGYKNFSKILNSQHANVDLKTHFDQDVAIDIIKQFTDININLIKTIIDEYQDILSAKTRNKLLNNFAQTQSQCRLWLNSENQPTFFKNVIQRTENIANDKHMPEIQSYKKIA